MIFAGSLQPPFQDGNAIKPSLNSGIFENCPRFLKHRPIGYFVGMIRLKMRSTPYGAAWTRASEGKHCVFSRV
jgi:hypothetical protein